MADSKLLLGSQGYDCLKCGKSCGGWRILVEPKVVDFLQDHPLSQRARERGYQPLRLHSDGWAHLSYDQDGRCLYLTEERLCGIQSESGFEHKPRACQQFPFFLVETPDGFQTGLSFCCTAVQAGHGRPLEEQRGELESLVASGAAYPQVGFGQIVFGGGDSRDWAAYRSWEGDLLNQLQAAESVSDLQKALGVSSGNQVFASLISHLEAVDAKSREWVRERCLAGESYLSPRFQTGVSPRRETLDDSAFGGLQRYFVQLVERKFLLGLDASVATRLAMMAEVPSLLACYGRVLQTALQCSGEVAFWCCVELLEGEIFAHQTENLLFAELEELLN